MDGYEWFFFFSNQRNKKNLCTNNFFHMRDVKHYENCICKEKVVINVCQPMALVLGQIQALSRTQHGDDLLVLIGGGIERASLQFDLPRVNHQIICLQ